MHRGKQPNLYFWRDSLGHEVNLIYQTAIKKIPIEIKSAKTAATDFFDTLHYWNTLSKTQEGYLIYDGPFRQKNKDIQLINWQNTTEIVANS